MSAHTLPRRRVVLAEQIRTVTLMLRVPALLATVGILLSTAVNVWDFVNGRGGVEFAPALSMLSGCVGAVLPVGVWTRTERIGGGFFWPMPVDRREHALIRVCAGWIFLMAVVGLFMLWLLALALFTRGHIAAPQELLLLPSPLIPPNGTLSAAQLRTAIWKPMPTLWLAPFTAATGTYLLASAFALGSRFPLRWITAVLASSLMLSLTGSLTHVQALKAAPGRALEFLYEGPYGLDALITAQSESLKTIVTLSDGKTVTVWREIPNLNEWGAATLLWIAIGLAALWAAASRHREQRSPSSTKRTD